jgi:hypothetical protein
VKNLVLGSVVTLILSIGLFVSQVEAKNDNNDDKGKNKQEDKFFQKNDKNKVEFQIEHQNNRGGSVPIPGTLLFMGGGFAGLVVWRACCARQQKPLT